MTKNALWNTESQTCGQNSPSISVATREERIRRSFDARAISTRTLTNFPSRQAIADLALEIELSGGKTSAYLAMRRLPIGARCA